VTDVQNVEDAIGKDQLTARGAQACALSEKFISGKNFAGGHRRTI
jgi:hypothetical protein